MLFYRFSVVIINIILLFLCRHYLRYSIVSLSSLLTLFYRYLVVIINIILSLLCRHY